MPDADTDFARSAALLAGTVRDAGALALRMFGTGLKTWTKGISSPVSEADIAVNNLIEARLRAATPGHGWLSEESAEDDSRLEKSLVWIIDPIDGTRSYLARQADWSVSAALVRDGMPVLAAVFAPVHDDFYFAVCGKGATLNGRPIHALIGTELDLTRMAGPKPILGRLADIAEGAANHARIGSLALRLCRVGDGRVDAAFAGGNSHDWDLAAADLIVHEAGGEMTEISGEPLIYNRADVTHGLLLAAGRDRHHCIVEHFRANPIS